MQAANRIAKNTMILYARMGITVFVSLYSTRLILAALGASDFGVFNVVGGVIAMLTFLNAAMTGASQRFMSYAQGEGDFEKQKIIFNVSITLHIIIGIALVFILEGAGYFFFNGILNIDPSRMEAAKLVYHFMVLSTFFTVISVPYDAVINAHENMLFVAIIGIIQTAIKLGIAFLITYTLYDKLVMYSVLMALLALIILVCRAVYCRKNYKEARIIVANHIKQPLFKKMTSFGGWSLLVSSSTVFLQEGQNIIINIFFGTNINAAQGVASQVGGQLGAVSSVVMKALNPVIAKKEGAGDRKQMIQATVIGSKLTSFIFLFALIPIMFEMSTVLNLWLIDVPKYAIIFCRLILLRVLIDLSVSPLNSALLAEGNIKKFQIVFSILPVLILSLDIVLFKLGCSPPTLYFISILYALIKVGIMLFFGKKSLGMPSLYFIKEVFLKIFIISGLGFIVCTIVFHLLNPNILRLFTILVINTFVMIISIYYYGLGDIERNLVKSILMKFKKYLVVK